MEHVIDRLSKVSEKRQRQFVRQMEKLDRVRHCTAVQYCQEAAWILEKYMKDIRLIEQDLVYSCEDGSWMERKEFGMLLPACTIIEDGSSYRIRFDAILPIKTIGRSNLLCEELEEAIHRYIAKHNLAIPLFEKAVVVFCHHYKTGITKRKPWDYDNLERKSILDALVPHFLRDDNPKFLRTMDMMQEGESDFTELLIMDWNSFQVFTMRHEFAF